MIKHRRNLNSPLERGGRRPGCVITSGFSLVEILVVTSVITLGFMAVLSLIRKAIIVYYNNQNYLVAATIAQQGLELTRYIRDDNWLTGELFNANITRDAQNDSKTIFAIDQQAMIDSDPTTPGNEGRQKIIKFYDSVDGNKLPDLPTGAALGNLPAYVKDSRAQIYFDRQNHNFYTTRAALVAVDNTGNTTDLFDANRHLPTIFHNLIQTIYRDNGTAGPEDDYVYVISAVYWQDRGADKYFSLTTYLDNYSWKY